MIHKTDNENSIIKTNGRNGKSSQVVFLSLLFMLLFSCSSESNQPMESSSGYLYIPNARQSFGKVDKKNTKIIKCSFPIKNIGKKNIVIKKIDVSCGCMSVEMTSKILRPQEQHVLIVKIETKNRIGFFNKTIYINSDAENSLELVRIKGEII